MDAARESLVIGETAAQILGKMEILVKRE